MIKLNNGMVFEEGMSLEGFMSANSLTAYSVAKSLFKESKVSYGRHVRSDIKQAADAQIIGGSERAAFNRRDNRWEITATTRTKFSAVAGNVLHDNAVKRALQKSAERHAKYEAEALAFREQCRKQWEADKAKREEEAKQKLEEEQKANEIASKLAAEMQKNQVTA